MVYTQYADQARKRGANVAEYRAAVALDAAVEILRDAAITLFDDIETWNTLVNAAKHITATSDGVKFEAEAIAMLDSSKHPYTRVHIELLAKDIAYMMDTEKFPSATHATLVLTSRIGGLGALMRYIAVLASLAITQPATCTTRAAMEAI